jgi:hypothetical protein
VNAYLISKHNLLLLQDFNVTQHLPPVGRQISFEVIFWSEKSELQIGFEVHFTPHLPTAMIITLACGMASI